MYEPTRVPLALVGERLGADAAEGLDGCMDQLLLDPSGRMHGLIAEFVRRQHPALDFEREHHVEEFVRVVRTVADAPNDVESVERFGHYPAKLSAWEERWARGATR